MRSSTDSKETLSEEAAEWLGALKAERSEESMRRFLEWLTKSADHTHAFLRRSAELGYFGPLDAIQVTVGGALRGKTEPERVDASMDSGHRGARKLAPWRKLVPWLVSTIAVLAVAVAVVGLGIGPLSWSASPPRLLPPKVFDSDAVHFVPLGASLMRLGERSRAEVAELRDHSGWRVRLIAGEANFSGAHASPNTLEIVSGRSVISPIGTEFKVRRTEDGTEVSVSDGEVNVAPCGAAPPREGQSGRGPEGQAASILLQKDQLAVVREGSCSVLIDRVAEANAARIASQ